VDNAQKIGLLPRIAPDRVHLCGNTALAGGEAAMCSADVFNRLIHIRQKTQVVNLATYSCFDDIFLKHLYFQSFQELEL
jgi:uncharacterized 2Fe-2S/4Fe-4S cluster protein (DUF4445 family)